MTKKSLIITIFILCFGLIMIGCPQKTVVKEEPSIQKEEAAKMEETAKKEDFKTCSECGEPSALDLCKACELLRHVR